MSHCHVNSIIGNARCWLLLCCGRGRWILIPTSRCYNSLFEAKSKLLRYSFVLSRESLFSSEVIQDFKFGSDSLVQKSSRTSTFGSDSPWVYGTLTGQSHRNNSINKLISSDRERGIPLKLNWLKLQHKQCQNVNFQYRDIVPLMASTQEVLTTGCFAALLANDSSALHPAKMSSSLNSELPWVTNSRTKTVACGLSLTTHVSEVCLDGTVKSSMMRGSVCSSSSLQQRAGEELKGEIIGGEKVDLRCFLVLNGSRGCCGRTLFDGGRCTQGTIVLMTVDGIECTLGSWLIDWVTTASSLAGRTATPTVRRFNRRISLSSITASLQYVLAPRCRPFPIRTNEK